MGRKKGGYCIVCRYPISRRMPGIGTLCGEHWAQMEAIQRNINGIHQRVPDALYAKPIHKTRTGRRAKPARD